MARAAVRRREIALRIAIGASRRRVLGQLLTESVVLSLCGSALALALAWVSVGMLNSLGQDMLPRTEDIRLDAAVLGYTALLAVLTAVLFGLAPAWRSVDVDPGEALQEGARAGGDARGHRVRAGLVVAGDRDVARAPDRSRADGEEHARPDPGGGGVRSRPRPDRAGGHPPPPLRRRGARAAVLAPRLRQVDALLCRGGGPGARPARRDGRGRRQRPAADGRRLGQERRPLRPPAARPPSATCRSSSTASWSGTTSAPSASPCSPAAPSPTPTPRTRPRWPS